MYGFNSSYTFGIIGMVVPLGFLELLGISYSGALLVIADLGCDG